MKKTYNYNGKEYNTISAIAREIGKTRLYTRDFPKYGITLITDDSVVTYTTVATMTTVTTLSTATTMTTVTTMTTATTYVTAATSITVDDKPVKKTGTDADIAEVELEVVNMDRYTFGKAITAFTLEALIKLATNAGVANLWDTIQNIPIRKMRLIMEIKEAYFPTGRLPKKAAPASPWKAIPTPTLINYARTKGIAWKEDMNAGINRMRVIMALKANNVNPDSVTK